MNKEITKKKSNKRLITIFGAAIIAIVFAAGYFMVNGESEVEFEIVKDKDIPMDITTDIIPEYQTLERALACVVDDKVYVIVTRGEKPTSGFNVSVNRMTIEENEGKTNLIVYADFKDPQKETAISQIITYPIAVVKTDIQKLPDTIELRIQY